LQIEVENGLVLGWEYLKYSCFGNDRIQERMFRPEAAAYTAVHRLSGNHDTSATSFLEPHGFRSSVSRSMRNKFSASFRSIDSCTFQNVTSLERG
jgi:hypothetical protein